MISGVDILQAVLALSEQGTNGNSLDNGQQENKNYRLARSFRLLFGERSVLPTKERQEELISPLSDSNSKSVVSTRFGRLCLRPENDDSSIIGIWIYVGHGRGDNMDGKTSYKKTRVIEYSSESVEQLRLNLEASGEVPDKSMIDFAMRFMLMVRTVQLLVDAGTEGYRWLPVFDVDGINSILKYEIDDFNLSLP